MKTTETKTKSTHSHSTKPFFQSKGVSSSDHDAEAAFFMPTPIQTKLTIGQPNDPYEKEADAKADEVVHQIQNKEQITVGNLGETTSAQVQTKSANQFTTFNPITFAGNNRIKTAKPIQKKEAEAEQVGDKEEETPTVQAKEQKSIALAPLPPNDDPIDSSSEERTYGLPQPGLESRIKEEESSGAALPEETLSEMEEGFGADFSEIQIHTDEKAEGLSEELGAQAFTHGSDIFFNKNKFDPFSMEGLRLIAHELTHTLQQGAAIQRKPNLQKEEALDLAQMLEELKDSNREQREAFDPSEANQTRKEAGEEGNKAERIAQKAVPEVVSVPPAPLPKPVENSGARVAKPKRKKPDKIVPSIQKEAATTPQIDAPSTAPKVEGGAGQTPTLNEPGPTAELLNKESEDVCNKAAEKAQNLADNEQAHDTSAEKAAQTDVAVEPPAEEGQSRSNAEQVDNLKTAEAPKPNNEQTKREMDQAISEAVPTKIKELNEFESEKRAQVIGNKVLADTTSQVGEVQGTYNEIEQAPAAAESETPVGLPAVEQAPKTPKLNLGEGAVPDVPEEQTDLSSYEEEADGIYEKEGVSQDMQKEFEKVDTGDIAEANKERGTLKQKVADEPTKLQTFAKEQQQGVEKDLEKEEQQVRGGMEAKRKKELEGAQGKQEKTKTEMEKKREAVTTWINNRYEQAKKKVTASLQSLEKQALTKFDRGQNLYSKRFEQNVKRRVNAWKRKRYSGFWGPGKWIKDKFVGIDHFQDIKNIFSTERAAFVKSIDQLIITINKENDAVIKASKEELVQANKDIQKFVDELGPDLKDVGQKAQKETEKKLAELDKHIEEEKKKLQQKLCDKKDKAIKDIDKKIEAMKAEMGGLLAKLGNLLLDVAKKFFKWAIEKIGGNADRVIELFNKGTAVLKALFTKPVNFFKNLVKAVGGGVKNFVTNIVEWLKKGLASWLLGAMGDTGLELPQKFDLKGILFVGLQIAGLTWNMIRGRIVKSLGPKGETIMEKAEQGVSIIQRIREEGPIAVWHIIVEKATEIKEKVMEGVRDWAITKIIQKATTKLLSMLNPAGAIVQAIMLLYDVVMFFINNWDRIISFVTTVFDSVSNIAKGAIGEASKFIEMSLGKTIPLILSFFARWIGLDGIGKAIQKVIKGIQKPFAKILDKIINFVVKQVRKFFGKLFGKGNKKSVEDEPIDEKMKHDEIGKKVKTELQEKDGKEDSFEEFYANKKEQAKQLENKYNPKLTPPVKLKIEFQPIEKDKKDKDLDIKIIIAPNDWTDTIQVESEAAEPYADVIAELKISAKEEKARLTAKIQMAKKDDTKTFNGNIAVAIASVPGIKDYEDYLKIIAKGSGRRARGVDVLEQQNLESNELPPEIDEAMTERNRTNPGFLRNVEKYGENPMKVKELYEQSIKKNQSDSERKIYLILLKELKSLADKRGIPYEELEGKLYMYTEKHPCTGCQINTEQFLTVFPKMDIKIFYSFEHI